MSRFTWIFTKINLPCWIIDLEGQDHIILIAAWVKAKLIFGRNILLLWGLSCTLEDVGQLLWSCPMRYQQHPSPTSCGNQHDWRCCQIATGEQKHPWFRATDPRQTSLFNGEDNWGPERSNNMSKAIQTVKGKTTSIPGYWLDILDTFCYPWPEIKDLGASSRGSSPDPSVISSFLPVMLGKPYLSTYCLIFLSNQLPLCIRPLSQNADQCFLIGP